MNFAFTRHCLNAREQILQRAFEILPGAVTWSILLGMICLSFWKPVIAALILIAFYVYWLLRVFYGILFLLLAYFRLSIERDTDWAELARGLRSIDETEKNLKEKMKDADWGRKVSLWIHRKELRALKKSGNPPPDYDDIYHLVLIPSARETGRVMEPGIRSFIEGRFPPEKILLVLAIEERAGDSVKRDAEILKNRYRPHFLDFLVVIHPDNVPGEARVKGANVTHAARLAASELKKRGIPFERVIVSCFDADTVVPPNYFTCLTYTFMVSENRSRASFQPIPVYHNNIWEVPGFAQVIETGSSFYILIESTNTEKLVTFSSHSMSFQALVEADYWPVDMISDDSSIFWKAFLHFDGNYQVIPLAATVSMDVADAGNWWKTAVSVYKQKQRWAWGVEGFPIVMRGFLANGAIPLRKKLRRGFLLLEGHITWATWPFLLTIMGWLPPLISGQEFTNTLVFYSSSRISSIIFTLSFATLAVIMALGFLLLPKRKVKYPLYRRIVFAVQWFFLPLTYIFLSAFPALDAQTHLLLGRYMEFRITDKHRGPHERNRAGSGKSVSEFSS